MVPDASWIALVVREVSVIRWPENASVDLGGLDLNAEKVSLDQAVCAKNPVNRYRTPHKKNTLCHIKCNFDLHDLNQNWQLKSSFCICLSEAPEEKAPFNDDHLFTINLHK